MSLQTFVLSEQTAALPVSALVEQAATGGVEIRNAEGKVVAFVLPADDQEAWAYAEASLDIVQHRDQIVAAMERRSGVTTSELLENADRAGQLHDLEFAIDVITGLVGRKQEELKAAGVRRPAPRGEEAGRDSKAG